ncbi:MAG: helix-turn-helix domain-containing protein, partial [Marinibacterium sp.]|nr:helix-turn-helix domain-containing protein [Marinibacterium sp.]
QLQPGQLGFRVAERVLRGIWLSLETQACALRSCHARRDPNSNTSFGASFGAILSDGPGHSWKGQPIGYGDVLVFGQASHDYTLPAGSLRLGIDVAPELAHQAGLTALPAGIWRTDTARYDQMVTLCLQLLARPDATCPPAQIMSTLLGALSQPAGFDPHARYGTLRRAEDYLGSIGWDKALAVDDMSAALGLSRRTLHRAFDDILGMGPASYIRLVRLHRFHTLLKSGAGHSSVTQAALDAGFDHFGRAARYYRTHFGRLPKEVGRLPKP